MSFGLRTWNEEGVLEMDTDSFTYQVMYNQLHSMDGVNGFTVQIPGFTPDKCVACILPTNPQSSEFATEAMPFITQGNGSVTLLSRVAGSKDIGSKVVFRLLAMRFRN